MTATLTTLVSFDGTDGANPRGDLVADSNGDIFGTTEHGGPSNVGTVFEITKAAGGYAATPTILINFNGTNGSEPFAGLIADANGDLFGTTFAGGSIYDAGSVFEIAKTPAGFASQVTTLTGFSDVPGHLPEGGLLADSNGDLFGTTAGGGAPAFDGEVFEIKKTAAGYASTPTTLVIFAGEDESDDVSDLIADANGDLFGTTEPNGAGDDGMVFEIVKTASGYASTPTILANAGSNSALVADANGDLFGTSPSSDTVFEIAKTPTGYASTPTTLVSFENDTLGGLLLDANGDLFGTTEDGGPDEAGTVFEVVKTAAGYASAPVTVASFNHDATDAFPEGAFPDGTLVADANGDLFGTTLYGGANSDGTLADSPGTVFEVTDSGFVTKGSTTPPTTGGGIVWRNASTGGVELWTPNGSGGFTYESLSSVNTSWQIAGTGDFTGSGEDGIVWRNASTGGVELWNPDGSGGFTYESLNPVNTNWQVAGTGDFTGSGDDGILWRNASTGGVELWNPNGSGGFTYEALNPVNTSWQVAGTGAFTGAGDDGILWRNASTGGVELWNSNGSGGFTYEALNPVNTNWQVAGTGDFTGSGKDGILWRNASTGGVELWNPNGSGGFTFEALNPVSTSWQVAATGDFTGSGEASILWRNASTGSVELWSPNGSGGFAYDNLGVVSTSWTVAGHL